jgi:hypothetical protein
MLLIRSRVRSEAYEPKGWRRLWEKAQRERDPQKLDAIIQRME